MTIVCLSTRDAYSKIDLDRSYPSLFELLWYSQLPCFDVLNVTSFELGYGNIKNNIIFASSHKS